MRFLAGLGILCAAACGAVAAQRQSWPLESVRVEGNRLYTEPQVIAASGLRRGAPAGQPDFERARQRLLATGAFERAGFRFAPAPDGKGVNCVLVVSEVQQVFPVQFEDLPAGEAELRQFLKSKDPLFGARIPATDAVLARYGKLLTEFAAARGLKKPVTGKLAAETSAGETIVFRPDVPRAAVAAVQFIGAEAVPAGRLQTVLGELAIGTPFREASIRELLERNVRPLYENAGRLGVSFPEIRAAKAANADGVLVTVRVNEGPVYKLGKLTVRGAKVPDPEVLKGADIHGDVARFDEIRKAAERVARSFSRNGYLDVKTELDRQLDERAKSVDVAIRVSTGPQFTFGKLEIEGLDLTTEPAIRKLWGLKPGKPFDSEYPDHFLTRLREDGVLENLKSAKARTVPHPESGTADVTLSFQ